MSTEDEEVAAVNDLVAGVTERWKDHPDRNMPGIVLANALGVWVANQDYLQTADYLQQFMRLCEVGGVALILAVEKDRSG